MAQVEDALASGLAAFGGVILCGHVTDQRISLIGDEGKTYCGDCWARFNELTQAYRSGALDQAGLRAGLTDLLAGFAEPPAPADLAAEVQTAITELDADIAADPARAPSSTGGP